MTIPLQTKDPAQEDREWVGYHPRAAIPQVVVAALASVAVWIGRWYFEDLSELANRIGGLAVFALTWCVWPALLTAELYRAVTYSYRLTNRAVLVDFGFWHRPVPPVWLSEVTEVRAGSGGLDRFLGVGWVELRAGERVVRLVGVRCPTELAERVRAAVAAGRKG